MASEETRAAPAGLRGKELLRAAVNQIVRHPDTWDQSDWHCGTSHCIGGHCQILAGYEADSLTARNQSVDAVGLSEQDANWLFNSFRSLLEIHEFAVSFLGDEPFFDNAGLARAVRDRNSRRLPLL